MQRNTNNKRKRLSNGVYTRVLLWPWKRFRYLKNILEAQEVFLLKLYFIFLLIVMMIIIKTQGIILPGKFWGDFESILYKLQCNETE